MPALKIAARKAGTSGTKCCCTPPVVLECKSKSSSATLVGHSEFTTPSTPPKKYLKKTGSGTHYRCLYFTACPPGGTIQGSDNQTLSGCDEYNPATGGWVTRGTITNKGNVGFCPATTVTLTGTGFWDGPHTSDGSWLVATVSRVQSRVGDGETCGPAEFGKFCVPSGYQQFDLTDEDTESAAEARATGTWGSWSTPALCSTCCVASRDDRTGFSWGFRSSKYRVGVTEGVDGDAYDVAVDYERRAIGATEWAVVATEYISVTCAPEPTDHSAWSEYDVPQLRGYETRATNARVYVP